MEARIKCEMFDQPLHDDNEFIPMREPANYEQLHKETVGLRRFNRDLTRVNELLYLQVEEQALVINSFSEPHKRKKEFPTERVRNWENQTDEDTYYRTIKQLMDANVKLQLERDALKEQIKDLKLNMDYINVKCAELQRDAATCTEKWTEKCAKFNNTIEELTYKCAELEMYHDNDPDNDPDYKEAIDDLENENDALKDKITKLEQERITYNKFHISIK